MAFTRISFVGLTAGMFLAMVSYRFVSAAYQGLIALPRRGWRCRSD